MKSIVLLLVVMAFLAASVAAQSATQQQPASSTGFLGTVAAQSCTALYNDQIYSITGTPIKIVPDFSRGAFGIGAAGLALLIVVVVLGALAVVYGIGYGFGIRKLVEFSRAEALESFFNLILIIAIAGSFATIGGYANFFASISGTYTGQQGAASAFSGTQALYTSLCRNIINTEVGPSAGSLLLTLLNMPLYTALQSLKFTVGPTTAGLVNFVPTVAFSPLAGVSLDYQLVTFLLMPLFIIIFVGITMNYLFFFVYFLFPIFLYVGVLLRSFPWTRAAGGSFLAFFISFYIVLPALYYPVTALAYNQIYTAQNGPCVANTASSGFGNCQAPTGLWTLIKSAGATIFNYATSIPLYLNPGLVFIQIVDAYVSFLALAVLDFIGLAIALIIAFDLLEALGDFFGSPSLTSGRVLERLI